MLGKPNSPGPEVVSETESEERAYNLENAQISARLQDVNTRIRASVEPHDPALMVEQK